jgi:DNA-binding PadR family transcriptional regulator
MNDLILLALLLEGPQHGYALKKKVGLVTGHGEMHNNLVYPLLKRFVQQGWVQQRSADGQRGQTRELYALTSNGKKELVRSLGDFGPKAAGSGEAFRFRISLFPLLDPATQASILDRREQWLAQREENLGRIKDATGARGWSAEVLAFVKSELRTERKWIKQLRKRMQPRGAAKGKG